MTRSEPVQLLVRLGCHLCEDAAVMLARAGAAFERVDVDSDAALAGEYGLLVPVLLRPDGAELLYPFSADEALRFLDNGKIQA